MGLWENVASNLTLVRKYSFKEHSLLFYLLKVCVSATIANAVENMLFSFRVKRVGYKETDDFAEP